VNHLNIRGQLVIVSQIRLVQDDSAAVSDLALQGNQDAGMVYEIEGIDQADGAQVI